MNQTYRALYIYNQLLNQRHINTVKLAQKFNVHQRTIFRDIENIRNYFHEISDDFTNTLLFDRKSQSYYISHLFQQEESQPLTEVTYELTQFLYQSLSRKYDIQILNRYEDKVKVTMKLFPSEAINLCFYYRKSMRLIYPEDLLAQFTTEFIKLQMIYLRHKL